jgi:excinuclease ABC subunit A
MKEAMRCYVETQGKDGDGAKELVFDNKFEADGMSFELPSQNLFNFNNPYGASARTARASAL